LSTASAAFTVALVAPLTQSKAYSDLADEALMAESDILPEDLRAEISEFHAVADETIKSIGRALDAREPPPAIYHYTNDVGLRGILESGKLWLTDIFNLNDPSELSHGFSHAVSILSNKAAVGHPWTKMFAQAFEKFGTQGGLQASAHFFVGSFSSSGDELGQWRAYADNGRGYTLGFDTKALESAFVGASDISRYTNSAFPVTYDDAQLAGIHRQFVETIFPMITLPNGRQLPHEVTSEYLTELSVVLAMHVARSVLFYKHEAYSNEKEYRFLQLHRADRPPAEVKSRARPYSLVRYREFDWRSAAPEALKRIVIGPSADHQRAVQFARDCLRSFHAGEAEITLSKIPYRAV
jgi:hypothetical protein